jgi:hypothetical protein
MILERLHVGGDLLRRGCNPASIIWADSVVAIDGDGFRYNPALVVGGSVNVHLEP